MSCLLTCDELNGMDWETILRSLIVLDDNGCFALRSTASGGGSYTFPANHGNTAYVATGGNNGTAEIGNISKPFTTVQAAIAALDANNDGEVIILSSSSSQTIDDIDYSNGDCPEVLTIKDLCSCGIEFTGTINFATLFIETQGSVIINTDTNWVTGDYSNIQCSAFTVPDTMVGTILVFSGCIECDIFAIEDNVNAGIQLDVVQWKKTCAIGVIDSFNYNDITPWQYAAVLNQSGTSAPTAIVTRNTTGETPTYSYINVGVYRITSPGNKFTVGYTEFLLGPTLWTGSDGSYPYLDSGHSTGEINFGVYSPVSFAPADELMSNTTLKINIYPSKY